MKHTKGNENPSDYLSRHTSLVCDDKQGTMAEEYVNLLTLSAVPKAMTLQEIQQATTEDPTLQYLMYLTQNQKWHTLGKLPQQFEDADITELKLFQRVKDDLTDNDQSNIILRGSHTVIPKALRDRAISIAHESHQGLVKTKQVLREANNSLGSHTDPLQISPLPPEPWHTYHSHGFLWSTS